MRSLGWIAAGVVAVVVGGALAPTAAFAEPLAPHDESQPAAEVASAAVAVAPAGDADAGDVRAGLNVRSDQGTHQVRIELGVRRHRAELGLVLDPMAARDGQTDLDLLLTRWTGRSRVLGLFVGWRTSSYSVIGGALWHQKLLLGALAKIAATRSNRVRLVGGIELCGEVVRHGDMIETEWFDYRSSRHFGDLVNFSLFARAELAFGI